MQPLKPEHMQAVFAVTDAMPLSREAIRVPLARVGEGAVARDPDGRFSITLPEGDDLSAFLHALPDRLRALGATPSPPTPGNA